MISEDPGTYDIHAISVGGWPRLVTPIIQFTKSLNYDPKEFPIDFHNAMESNINKLIQKAEIDSNKPTSYVLRYAGVLPVPDGVNASKVVYGFKAPIAMTLAPWFAHVIPHFKFIHVLR